MPTVRHHGKRSGATGSVFTPRQPKVKGVHGLDEPARDDVASDIADLTRVSLDTLRELPTSARTRRLLDEVRRGRSNAMGDGTPPQSGVA